MDTKEFGILIKKKRMEKQMNQSEFANCLHVSRTTVSKWETGINFPDLQNLESISQLLNIPLAELLNQGSIADADQPPPETIEFSPDEEKTEEPMQFPPAKQKGTKVKSAIAVLSGAILIFVISFTIMYHKNTAPPVYTIIDSFYGSYDDMDECYCFIVTCQGKFSEDTWYDYTETLREQYKDYFNHVQAIAIFFFDSYNKAIDTFESADHFTTLYSY